MGALTIFFVVVLGTWTFALVVETMRAVRRARALDKAMEINDRTREIAKEFEATAREHDRVSAERRKIVQALEAKLEEDIEREHAYNTEYRQKLETISSTYQERAQNLLARWEAERGPNATTAEMLALMIADADTDDGTETVTRLLRALHEAWPEISWRHLVRKHHQNPGRW